MKRGLLLFAPAAVRSPPKLPCRLGGVAPTTPLTSPLPQSRLIRQVALGHLPFCKPVTSLESVAIHLSSPAHTHHGIGVYVDFLLRVRSHLRIADAGNRGTARAG